MKIYNTEGAFIPDVQDALYELGNAGTGMVSVSIGKLLNVRIAISVPEVVSFEPESQSRLDIHLKDEVVAFMMQMKEIVRGDVAFVIEREFVRSAVQKLTGEWYSYEELMEDECAFSAVQEFGNIIGSSYVKAIGQYTGVRFYLSPVSAGISDAETVLNMFDKKAAEKNANKIYVASRFTITEEDGTKIGPAGHAIMRPNQDSVEELMELIGF